MIGSCEPSSQREVPQPDPFFPLQQNVDEGGLDRLATVGGIRVLHPNTERMGRDARRPGLRSPRIVTAFPFKLAVKSPPGWPSPSPSIGRPKESANKEAVILSC